MMDYEAINREMSCYVVTSVRNGVRFFLTDQNLPTDILSRAKMYRDADLAYAAAQVATREYTWKRYTFTVMSVPQAKVEGKG